MIFERKPHPSGRGVYRALTYYHDHPDEMRAVEREREEAVEDYRHLTTDPDAVRD